MDKSSIALAVGLLIIGGLTGAVIERFATGPDTAMGQTLSLQGAKQLLNEVTHGQANAEKVFPGPGGLTGIEVSMQGHPTIAYATGDGQYLVAGPVLNRQGQDAAHADMIKLGLISKPATAATLAEKAAHADSFVLGSKGPELTAFVDPNCIYCHKFYEQAQPLIAAGKLRVRYVVVAFLKPSSAGKAAAILGASNPAAAMAANEKGFDEATEEGGITPAQHPDQATLAAVENNTKLLSDSGEVATPTLIYCNAQHQTVLAHGLDSSSLADFVQHIGSLENGACQ
ncbi:thiol:disulfide interchange protein DsbG [Acidithiobacillus marinus]|uniref:Thiol:disulfide interchange protein DsbG n=1 Tax=Acidithiobacillus marinus TaxID=187490 RepID=A0A2I1DJ91_9PROT|nr:thiol:disulfide interchange protein DsbG [Acidithiobacillus marinus]PKY09947.1 thiol:disulfide interchange protein DsbG [Acidithiobacillus marinus]